MKNPLPSIDGSEQLRLHRCGVIRDAEALRRKLACAVGTLNPASVVAMAMSRHPKQAPELALHALQNEVDAFLKALEASNDELRTAHRAEEHRLAGAVAAATHRTLEIAGAVAGIDSRIRCSQSFAEGKRERLRKAGLSGDELDRAASPFDPGELQAERAALLAEQSALEKFLQTRDTQHLPDGFADKPA